MSDRKNLEKQIFRKLFSSSSILEKYIFYLSENDFTNETYKLILKAFAENYGLIKSLTNNPDYFKIILRKYIFDEQKLEKISNIMANIVNSNIDANDIDILIKELKSHRLCDEITNSIKSILPKINPDTVTEAYEILLKKLLDIPTNNNFAINVSQLIEVHDDLEERIKMYSKNNNNKIPTFIKAFDIVTGGFAYTELVTIAAGTGQGKSNVMLWWAERYVENGYNVLFITIEMSKEEILNRYNSIQTGINVTDIARKKIPEKLLGEYYIKLIANTKDKSVRDAFIRECLYKKLHKKANEEEILKIASKYINRKSKLFILDMQYATPSKIEQEIQKIKNNHKLDIVFVDFINVIESDLPHKDRARELAIISRELKRIAKRQNVLLFTAAQLNTVNIKETELTTDSIKYSRAISENSDWVIAFHRTEEDKMLNLLKLKFVKHRHSSPCTALLNFDFSNMKVKDLGFAEESMVPPGYDKEGNKLEYVYDGKKEDDKYLTILEEYEDILKEIDNNFYEETRNEFKNEPIFENKEIYEDLKMLNKLKEIFPDCKIRLATKDELNIEDE